MSDGLNILRMKIIFRLSMTMHRQRTAILQAVHKLRSHPTVDEILTETRRSLNCISLATVYRGPE